MRKQFNPQSIIFLLSYFISKYLNTIYTSTSNSTMSSSRGDAETAQLKKNIEGQLARLMTQLSDLEEMKEDMEDDEYDSERQATLDQLQDFEKSLEKMLEGNISLVDDIGAMQLKIQAATREAVQAQGNAAKMFEKKGASALRGRLAVIQQELRTKRISSDAFDAECIDIIKRLEKEDTLTDSEKELFKRAKTVSGFEKVVEGDVSAKEQLK